MHILIHNPRHKNLTVKGNANLLYRAFINLIEMPFVITMKQRFSWPLLVPGDHEGVVIIAGTGSRGIAPEQSRTCI